MTDTQFALLSLWLLMYYFMIRNGLNGIRDAIIKKERDE